MTVGPLIHCGLLVQVGAICRRHTAGRDSSLVNIVGPGTYRH